MSARVLHCAAAMSFIVAMSAAFADSTATGAMSAPRGSHVATRLQDGRVLLTGGEGLEFNVPLSSADLYDPLTRTWHPAAPMLAPRKGHTATLLDDGTVLVIGGTDARQPHPDAEIYDPRLDRWIAAQGIDAQRAGHTATSLGGFRVLVAGGGTFNPFPDTFVYDAAAGRSTAAGNLIFARTGHAAMLLPDGRVLFVGGTGAGYPTDDYPITDAEFLDPASNRRSTVNMVTQLIGATIASLSDGRLFVQGLSYFEGNWTTGREAAGTFDVNVGTWTVSRRAAPLAGGSVTALDSSVLLAGGCNYNVTPPTITSAVERFDAITNAWRKSAPLASPRCGHTATRLNDGTVLIAGGQASARGRPQDTAELYALPVLGAIDASFTGSWFNPAQAGHGLLVQVLPDKRFLAAWFTFDSNANQMWLFGTGTYDANVASIPSADMFRGGRWPTIDARDVQRSSFGSLKLTFTDCTHGRVDVIQAGAPVYGMDLVRLTMPAGLSCE